VWEGRFEPASLVFLIARGVKSSRFRFVCGIYRHCAPLSPAYSFPPPLRIPYIPHGRFRQYFMNVRCTLLPAHVSHRLLPRSATDPSPPSLCLKINSQRANKRNLAAAKTVVDNLPPEELPAVRIQNFHRGAFLLEDGAAEFRAASPGGWGL